ncbi:methyl-accepting chemotaxis protein [Hahella sp. SMD15-11]|uniref:Methyl-accepting chemotaxis protein n=1 Tax=Thermohahella caldifontis TaxID=3142973 RepID=A0AB39URC7_9GAMM
MLNSLRTRLVLLSAVPLLLALIFVGINLDDARNRYENLHALHPAIRLAGSLSALVHELQKERGASAGYLASGQDSFRDLLTRQRQNTDKALADLDAALANGLGSNLPPAVRKALQRLRDNLPGLPGLRGQVDQQALSVRNVLERYTALNTQALQTVDAAGQTLFLPGLRNRYDAYTAFLNAKERAGIERAVLSAVFGADQFRDGLARDFIRLVAEQEVYLGQFRSRAPEAWVGKLDEVVTQPAFAEVNAYRQSAFTAIEALTEKRPFTGFDRDAASWFQTITRKINQLKALEDMQQEDLETQVATLLDKARGNLWRDAIIAIAAVLLVLTTTLMLARSLMRPINRAVAAAERIGQGDLTTSLDSGRKDELGTLLRALKAMQDALRTLLLEQQQQTQELASVATQIQGSAVQVSQAAEKQKEEADQLATAMNEMTASFHEVAQSTEHTAEAARRGSEQSESGLHALDQLLEAMAALNTSVDAAAGTITQLEEKTRTIATTLGTISGIAEQTNLLALNAAIEAARAGEQGRGFAVVADEVRQLAGRTQEATVEITQIIQSLTEEVEQAVGQMNAARERSADADAHCETTRNAIRTINAAISDITDRIQQVASASTEQSAVAEEINRNVQHIADLADDNAEAVQQNRVASDALEQMATRMVAHVRRFRLS